MTVSVIAVTVLLGLLALLLMRTRLLSLGGALVCVLFGFVLSTTPAGPSIGRLLDSAGAWLLATFTSL